MSTLVEMIEALQADWQKRIRNHFLAIKGKYCPHARKAISECVSDLAPILAAAREQAQELAAMKEQHSADLREVAEMSRLFCKNIIINRCREHGNWKKDGAPSKILRYEASDLIDGLSADSIVREFREKKDEVKAHG